MGKSRKKCRNNRKIILLSVTGKVIATLQLFSQPSEVLARVLRSAHCQINDAKMKNLILSITA